MTGYEAIDGKIQEWAERNSLYLFTSCGDEPMRLAHVSSEAGECFCISIGRPDEGIVHIAAGCVEGRNDLQPAEVWSYPIESIVMAWTLLTEERRPKYSRHMRVNPAPNWER